MHVCSSNSRRQGRGFTLVELMVSLAVIAVLLSIAFPAYYAVRSASLSAGCKGNLSAIGKAYILYAADHASRLPIYDDFERDPDGVIRQELFIGPWGAAPNPELHHNVNHAVILPTDQAAAWSYPLRTYLTDEPENAAWQASEIVACPTVFRKRANVMERGISDPISLAAESYFQSPALFTEIPPWSALGGVVVNRDYAPVSLDAVAHSSNKTLLVETTSYHDGAESVLWEANGALFNVLATDGHVSMRESVLTERATAITGLLAGAAPCPWCDRTPLLTTTGGAAGADW